MGNKQAIIYTDGGADPNPGPGAIGVVIKNSKGDTLATISRGIGRTTNNQAEYRAVIAGLEKALAMGIEEVVVRADSELVVRQLNGRYKVRNPGLKPLYLEVTELRQRFTNFTIRHIPRRLNAEADQLAGREAKHGKGE
jgi:ribonuclease HI